MSSLLYSQTDSSNKENIKNYVSAPSPGGELFCRRGVNLQKNTLCSTALDLVQPLLDFLLRAVANCLLVDIITVVILGDYQV